MILTSRLYSSRRATKKSQNSTISAFRFNHLTSLQFTVSSRPVAKSVNTKRRKQPFIPWSPTLAYSDYTMAISIKYTVVALALLLASATAFSPIKPSRTTIQLSSEKKDASAAAAAVMEEANEALASVGWAPPSSDVELTSDDPFVRQIDASIRKDMGVGLEELLNPAKVSVKVLLRSLRFTACLLDHLSIIIRWLTWNVIYIICDWIWPWRRGER